MEEADFGLFGGEVAFLTSTLIVIDLMLVGLFWAWGADEDVFQRLLPYGTMKQSG